MSDTVYHQTLLHETPDDDEDDREIDLEPEILARPSRRRSFTHLLRDLLSLHGRQLASTHSKSNNGTHAFLPPSIAPRGVAAHVL